MTNKIGRLGVQTLPEQDQESIDCQNKEFKDYQTTIRSTESDHDQDFTEKETTIGCTSTEGVRPEPTIRIQSDHDQEYRVSVRTITNMIRSEETARSRWT